MRRDVWLSYTLGAYRKMAIRAAVGIEVVLQLLLACIYLMCAFLIRSYHYEMSLREIRTRGTFKHDVSFSRGDTWACGPTQVPMSTVP